MHIINSKGKRINITKEDLWKLPLDTVELYCSGNQLTSLPELPPSLQGLYCSDNPLDKIYPDLKKETINLWNRTALFVQTKWRIKERVKLCPYHKLGRKHMEEEWKKFSNHFVQ